MNPVFQALVPALQVSWGNWWGSASGDSWGYGGGSYGSGGGSWT
ncbi:MAG: hypothetical protein ACRDJC_07030 [Thermomicrobiales bacterium]